MYVAKLTEKGGRRVLSPHAGMVFIIDCMTLDHEGKYTNIHVRDYRFPNDDGEYVIWTLKLDYDCELIEMKSPILK